MPKNNSLNPSSVRRNLDLIRKLEEQALSSRTTSERVTDAIGSFCGSMPFVILHLVAFGAWILINTTDWGIPHFDPYPFMLMNVAVSLEAIFLSTFVLMKQNRMGRRSDARAHLDLQINLLAEREMTLMLKMLASISEHMGLKEWSRDPHLRDLLSELPVEEVAKELETGILD